MAEQNGRRALKYLLTIFLIFSVIVTVAVGAVVVANFNHLGRFVRVFDLIRDEYLEPASTDQLVDGATRGIVSALKDPYSTYLDAQENEKLFEQIEGKFGGVGILLSVKDPKKLVVMRPLKSTPAAKAGIQPGDVILKIDNTDTSAIEQDKAVALMRGDPGTKVTLVLYRESENRDVTVTLTREKITVPTVEGKALPGHPEMAYIEISQFALETGNDLAEALKSLDIKKYKGIILDLRYNPGGKLESAVQAASYFIPPGPVTYIVDKNGNVDTKNAADNYLNMPLVVLVNGESASAAEIVSGAIKDKGTGTLIGVKTFGKGIVQTIFPLDSGTSVKLTTAKYLTPNKLDIHKKGIEPDVQVELGKDQDPTISPVNTKFDPQLQTAVEVLAQKIGKH